MWIHVKIEVYTTNVGSLSTSSEVYSISLFVINVVKELNRVSGIPAYLVFAALRNKRRYWLTRIMCLSVVKYLHVERCLSDLN